MCLQNCLLRVYCSVRIFRLCLGEDFVCSEGLNKYLFCVCKNCWRCHQREININKIFKESKEGIMRQIVVWIEYLGVNSSRCSEKIF